MKSDREWRIESAYILKYAKLRRQKYRPWSEDWDHDHCAACWAKFGANAQDLREGFATTEDHPQGPGYHWVCTTCFADLKDEMRWTAIA